LVSTVIKNWDNNNWLSSRDYIYSFNKFLTKQVKLNTDSKILDIGCGRGKILGNLSSKLKLKNKPLGIDIINHKDKDKRIRFKHIDANSFFLKNRVKYDLILIKQTIHLLNFKEIRKVLSLANKNLSSKGKILIFTLDINNELPTFKLMKIQLAKSLDRDKKILRLITKLYSLKKKKFVFKVRIRKKEYLSMVQKRYISVLLNITFHEIQKGLNEINNKYKKIIKFRDKLICLIL
tara:strand:- start:1903 stop:2607 length:705 start_codon:yes stop_codon:yes gene_type:complete